MDSQQEQLFHDLEQRHVSLRKEHEAVCIERDALRGISMHIMSLFFVSVFFLVWPYISTFFFISIEHSFEVSVPFDTFSHITF